MKRVVRVGVAHHSLERHPFCDSPINIVVCLIACQFAALVTVRQPIFKHLSTAALRPACPSSLSRHRKPAHYSSSTAYVVHPPASRQPHRQFNHYTTASQLRANCRKLQPILNRPSTATSTILQPPSNHHSSASRHLFVRHSAAHIHPPRTRTSPTLHTPPTRRADIRQPSTHPQLSHNPPGNSRFAGSPVNFDRLHWENGHLARCPSKPGVPVSRRPTRRPAAIPPSAPVIFA